MSDSESFEEESIHDESSLLDESSQYQDPHDPNPNSLLWYVIGNLPEHYRMGLDHDLMEVKVAYKNELPFAFKIGPKRRAPRAEAREADVTDLILKCLAISTLECLKIDGGWVGIRYQFAPVCKALKAHQSVRGVSIFDLEITGGSLTERVQLVQGIFAGPYPNKTLEKVHLSEQHPGRFSISTMEPSRSIFTGCNLDVWMHIATKLNLNTLGRWKLVAGVTSPAEFVTMIDPLTIRKLVEFIFFECIKRAFDFYEDGDGFMVVNTSLQALNNNHSFLMICLECWMPMVYNDVRTINLLYGMLRHAPLVWCTVNATKKRRFTAFENL